MLDDPKDNLGGIFGDLDASAPAEEPEVVETPPVDAPVVEPEQQQPAEETPQEAPQEKNHTVPLATFLDQKLEAREAKKEAEALRRQLAERDAQPAQAVQRPDPYEDPEGYDAYNAQRLAQTEWNIRASMSERFAVQAHGAELVKTATDWGLDQAKSDPAFAQKVMSNPDPVGFTIEQYNRDLVYQRISSDPTLMTQIMGTGEANPGAVAPQNMAAPAVAPKPAPPRSLATAPSSGAMPQGTQSTGNVFKDLKFNLD